MMRIRRAWRGRQTSKAQGQRQSIVWLVTVMVLWSHGTVFSQGDPVLSLSELIRESLRQRLETASLPTSLMVEGQRLHATGKVLHFYAQQSYHPAWSNDAGLIPQVESFLATLRAADQNGLRPEEYHLGTLARMLPDIRRLQATPSALSPEKLTVLDLLLTDAFLAYGMHALTGRVHPNAVQAQWFTERQQADIVDLLQQALETNRLQEALQTLLPPEPGYDRLRQALAEYRALASRGGWPQIAAGPSLQIGDRDARVKTLHTRLWMTGELPQAAPKDARESELFDEAVDKAVRRFQQRHGLPVDGVVRAATLAALNVPVESRLRQIATNMERWRWLPHRLGRQYILVNIARFALEVIEDDKPVLSMRIIVGKPYQSTPAFNATMTHLVVNPSWYVPPSIAREELLPVLRRDPGYLSRQKMRVYHNGGGEIDPRSINWSQVSAANFPYRLRQIPGPKNPLGRMKFLFPNQFSVYLHDTSNPELFARAVRTFSHGCIRVEKPVDLAAYLLRTDPRWSRGRIQEAIARGTERHVSLPAAMPVYLLYWTAWVDADGTLHFRDDIYQRDTKLEKALFGPPGTL